jgi:hypothetical protein
LAIKRIVKVETATLDNLRGFLRHMEEHATGTDRSKFTIYEKPKQSILFLICQRVLGILKTLSL